MAAFCLPPQLAGDFLKALQDGRLDPEKLAAMSSAERRAAFAEHVGPEMAQEVNAEFETKMLLKDQKAGLERWAQKTAGLTEPARRDILASINRLDRVLQPEDEQGFLADLAAKKLGTTVTADEARQVFQLSQTAEAARATMLQDVSNLPNRIAYGRALMDLLDRVESLKPDRTTLINKLINVLSVPKSAMTSILHFSAPFVQGWGMLSTRVAWEGFGKMFQYFADEENYRDLTAYIISHPDYALARDGKLGLTDVTDKFTQREEAIQSTLVEQANEWLSAKTGVPNLVRMSGRAFTGYLNYVRANRFYDLIQAARMTGEDVRPGSQVVKDIAAVVNNFTGRGELGAGDKYASAGPLLNAVFFAPRKVVATVEMFNPIRYLDPRTSPTARKAAIRQLVGSLVATSAVLAIAKAMGANVNPDPRSSDFAKIDIGGEKLDLTGGNGAYLRLLARIATNQEINSHGKLIQLGQGYQSMTRANLVANYLRGKLSPTAAVLVDALYGKDAIGQPFSLTDEARDKLLPIWMSSYTDYAINNPHDVAAFIPSLASFLGVGLESPLPPMSKSGLTVWGDPIGASGNFRADPVNQEFERLGYTPGFPADKIRGIPLTDAQSRQYAQLAGRLAHQRLTDVVSQPGWAGVPSASRLRVMKSIVMKSRDIAATTIMVQSQGGANDIIKKATDAKMAAATAP